MRFKIKDEDGLARPVLIFSSVSEMVLLWDHPTHHDAFRILRSYKEKMTLEFENPSVANLPLSHRHSYEKCFACLSYWWKPISKEVKQEIRWAETEWSNGFFEGDRKSTYVILALQRYFFNNFYEIEVFEARHLTIS